ncbi:phosphopentomutase [Methylocapsa acidiphila]|uniref:Phosphopentomutase n=1 Tax=Methylocapsa acidiphila TaxID=133552 RepID=Q2VNJ8_METAI|nr:phosphopentomutase [Methylocapsa acidiphila]CAJ01634.1 putative phosphopentomutase [Methylocapsa acidiphila]
MPRAIVLVLDSLGCGGAEDAAAYGDAGANTLGHLAGACASGRGDREGFRSGALRAPNLDALGLGLVIEASSGAWPEGFSRPRAPGALWGYAVERAHGKDTPAGHWEMAGAPAAKAFFFFPRTDPCFPPGLTEALIAESGIPGVLGNCHASGVEIIERLGAEHLRTGAPICYTSADSVFQIAAHEDAFGLERLYALCRIARRLCDPLNVGRVIARPFLGDADKGFERTPRRKDFAIPPPLGNLLERLVHAGHEIVSIGKVGDIFAHCFTGREVKRDSDMAHFDATLESLRALPDGGLIFTNFVDLDTEFGHRRDIAGYARCLERFDARLPELLAAMQPGDLAVISADHGTDPTWSGCDHTREHAPILAFGPGVPGRAIGRRESFADIGASLAAHLGLPATAQGSSFL